jgi:hypothetical protein
MTITVEATYVVLDDEALEPTVTRYDIDALRDALATASGIDDPVRRAIELEMVACRAHVLRDRLVDERNVVAAYLVHRAGWPLSRVGRIIGVGPRDRAAFERAVLRNPQPKRVPKAEERLTDLVELSAGVHRVWSEALEAAARAWEASRHTPTPPDDLPDAPDERLAHIRERIASTKAELAEVTGERNAVARAVIEHWGWPVEPVRRIAGTGRDRTLAAEPAPKRPNLDRRLADLSIRARELRDRIEDLNEAQRLTVRHAKRQRYRPAEVPNIEALSEQVETALATGRGKVPARSALRKARAEVRETIYQAAAVLHLTYGWSLAELQAVIGPASRNTVTLSRNIAKVGVPARMSRPEAEALLRERVELHRQLLDLQARLRGAR